MLTPRERVETVISWLATYGGDCKEESLRRIFIRHITEAVAEERGRRLEAVEMAEKAMIVAEERGYEEGYMACSRKTPA